ncbi:predicted protein [Arabidopsis lyrata subsp. lyrata]|uniref:Predicted protein n=1 Tax=Arabidopsis lyrata subsp. lyrata TaxID=81972 RepID=D7LAC3_ARALL|nr:predicted protein [Arabidopsis lyrata subsp. lyrata]
MGIILPNTAISEAGTKLSETASLVDSTLTLGELSLPVSSNVISTPQGDTTSLEVTLVATDVADMV